MTCWGSGSKLSKGLPRPDSLPLCKRVTLVFADCQQSSVCTIYRQITLKKKLFIFYLETLPAKFVRVYSSSESRIHRLKEWTAGNSRGLIQTRIYSSMKPLHRYYAWSQEVLFTLTFLVQVQRGKLSLW